MHLTHPTRLVETQKKLPRSYVYAALSTPLLSAGRKGAGLKTGIFQLLKSVSTGRLDRSGPHLQL